MKSENWRIITGFLVLVIGLVALAQTLGYLPTSGEPLAVLLGAILAAGGIAFLWVLVSSPRSNWWAAIPGVTLATLAVLILVPAFIPALNGPFWGGFFLAGIGLSFWVVYLINPQFWWAVIPGGVLVTLAVISGLPEIAGGESGGAILFVGLATTFGLLMILPTGAKRMTWPLYPAAACLGVAAIISLSSNNRLLNLAGPAVLIIAGLFLVARTILQRNTPPQE
jgi:hypothetical protein